MSDLTLEPLSSRDVGGHQTLIDLTKSLWSTETISTVTAVPADAAKLTVVSVEANASEMTVDGSTVAIGKGVVLTVNTVATDESSMQRLRMRVVGTEQFKRDYDLDQPIVVAVKE